MSWMHVSARIIRYCVEKSTDSTAQCHQIFSMCWFQTNGNSLYTGALIQVPAWFHSDWHRRDLCSLNNRTTYLMFDYLKFHKNGIIEATENER